MFNKQLKTNIKQLDLQIGKLSKELSEMEDTGSYEAKAKMEMLKDLTKLRCELADSKVKDKSRAFELVPLLASGAIHLTSVLMVLKHEKTDVITSKVWNTVASPFRGKK